MEKRRIDFSPPDISEKEIELVAEALRSGWITTGPKTKQFEKEIAEFCGTSKAAALNSQTACAEMTLRLLGIGEGDEVIVPAYTYTASASIVCHVGAKLVICDLSDAGFEMDYDKMEELITSKTKAVIPVDLAGIMCDYKKIYEIIERKKNLFEPKNDIQKAMGRIAVCADGAHSFGASQYGKRSGSVADFTSFSFHAVKNLTTAEGGAVTWRSIDGIDNEDIYKQYMLLSLHGQSKDALAKTKLGSWEYDIVAPNFKCNMTDVHAAIGLAQLERYEEILMKREKFIKMYNDGLKDIGVGFLNHYGENHKSSGHLYLCSLKGKNEEYRNLFIEKMAERGIATNVHYKPLPMLTAYKNLGFDICDYPNAYDRYHNEVSLPLNTKMTEQDVEYVIENFKEIWGK
ncbi:MAG: DegT/DnrJ/EryC1/StrS aminotransferase family protein [Ruminococcaceae bacterium]|nr:DegT/DnrJ/EryC1/StrS aminotransferase family protein [Oscillospiraceae bacterium]